MSGGSGNTSRLGRSLGSRRVNIATTFTGIRRNSSLKPEDQVQPGFVKVLPTDPKKKAETEEVLKHLRIPVKNWEASRRYWQGKARILDGYQVVDIPKEFRHTAVLCQYMRDSLIVLYKRKNSKGRQVYKLLEFWHDKEEKMDKIWDFPERNEADDKNPDINLQLIILDYCKLHNLTEVMGCFFVFKGNGDKDMSLFHF